MIAIELQPQSEIRLYKEALTRKLNTTAINHYSQAQIKFKVTDDTLKNFLIIISFLLGSIIILGGCVLCIKKLQGKGDKKTTFDVIDGLMMKESMQKDMMRGSFNSQGNQQDDGYYGDDHVSQISDYFESEDKNKSQIKKVKLERSSVKKQKDINYEKQKSEGYDDEEDNDYMDDDEENEKEN